MASLESIFDVARRLAPEEREAYLARACEGNDELREQVEGLIRADAAAGSFLGRPSDQTLIAPDVPIEKAGDEIGRYRLLQQIGEGGFGAVWMAEQREPVKRRVALKIIKLGMDTKQVIARFEAERQALAIMDHPNIAKVLDAGSTATGRPFFVMEYIRGIPLLEYCDTERRDMRTRLELFTAICQAIQHAHQKGIIHRDIKPGNVLITMHDGVPVPKVIDFGIAKATNATLTTKTLFTEHRQMIGTPAYMSPEQAEMSELDIDTRSDVYSLGVLLYELLTGTTPFATEDLLSKGFAEMLRIIRDEEPPKPSTRLSESDTLASAAANRHTEPRKLGMLVRGDLDWIVMKALAKERTRRYDTASALADDVRHFLEGDPVSAAPPTASYRVRKFVRRHRGLVGTVAAVTLALVAGVIAFAWQAAVARDARDRAQIERSNAVAAEERAQHRADELELVSQFYARMLEQVNPTTAGRQLTDEVMGQLDEALEQRDVDPTEKTRILREFREAWTLINATDAAIGVIDRNILAPATRAVNAYKDQPVVDARLRQALADRYREFALFDAAAPLQRDALRLRRETLGNAHPDTLKSLLALGYLVERSGRRGEVEPIWREALDRSRAALGDEHPQTIGLLDSLGYLCMTLGRRTEAQVLWEETLDLRRRVLGDDHPATMSSIVSLGELLHAGGALEEAEVYFREGLERRRDVLGDEHTNTTLTMARLATVLEDLGRHTEAEPIMREALARYDAGVAADRAGLRTDFQPMGGLSARLAGIFITQGQFERAIPYAVESMEKKRRSLGGTHQFSISATTQLGRLHLVLGDMETAEPLIVEALEDAQQTLGKDNEVTRRAMSAMGALLMDANEPREARTYFEQVLELDREHLGPDHLHIARDLADRAEAHAELRHRRAARADFDEAIEMQRRLSPEGSTDLARLLWRSAKVYFDGGDTSAGLQQLDEAIEIAERLMPPNHPHRSEYVRLRDAQP